ncbi:hypothetical protein MUK70_24865 [Dyadobacter chenwenxiniae]|uniref:DUF2442 domain-containing protein n=1 Tax=Dyadobacter chenwenxiniae TaxID=2906456 RepID=A0A9X1PQF7_9BACT|nr:hypothetical protein [Dyadobacter chenwenxiniae]MCF0051216.1 hypothetical protein [Dyadobacter chenwenxiniae]MCF0064534.1 hypothetical protein [Dyadobacter chenwenxiniae]UON82264.1 hypothetical protein MUK70_24865 [Dyadobacter chenwenxiniae]
MNPRVKEILSIKPFTIKVLWSDDKVRTIDFGSFLSDYFQKEHSLYYKILNEQRFLEAKTDGRTIYWDNVSEMVDYDGKLIPAPLDFCPDVLFQQSVLED